MSRIPILEQDFTLSRGNSVNCIQFIIQCPIWSRKVNVKGCKRCTEKQDINYVDKYVICNWEKN